MSLTTPYTSLESRDDFGSTFSVMKFSVDISAGNNAALTIPGRARAYKAYIIPNNGVYVALNGTAAIPAGSAFASTTSEFMPGNHLTCREVRKEDVLDVFAQVDTEVTIALYTV